MVTSNTHGSGNILLIKHQHGARGGMVDPFLPTFKPPLECKAVFANIMIQATDSTVFFCIEHTAKRFAKVRHIFKMLFQKLSFRMSFRWAVRQIRFYKITSVQNR